MTYRNCLMLIALWLSASVATADDALCIKKSEFATVSMKARQAGVPLSAVLDSISEGDTPADVASEMKRLAIAAYKSPDWRGEDQQTRAATEFANSVLIECMGEG